MKDGHINVVAEVWGRAQIPVCSYFVVYAEDLLGRDELRELVVVCGAVRRC